MRPKHKEPTAEAKDAERALKAYARIQALLMSLGLLCGLGFLIYQCVFDPDICFIFNDSHAAWISPPLEVDHYRVRHGDQAPVYLFRRTFDLDKPIQPGRKVTLRLKVLGSAKVFVNHEEAGRLEARRGNWKNETEFEVAGFLRPGTNTIEAAAWNNVGPPLLYLYLHGADKILATDPAWEVGLRGEPPVRAIEADDTRPYQEALRGRTALKSFQDKKIAVALFFVVSAFFFWLHGAVFDQNPLYQLPLIALIVMAVLWMILLTNRFSRLIPTESFDARGHLLYIFFILKEGRLPYADEGWTMFHPPLYYLLSAVFLKITGFPAAGGGAGQIGILILRLIPFLCGAGHLYVAYCFAKKMWAGDSAKVALAMVMAGMIPMNIYLSAYIGNEPTHALLADTALLLTVSFLGPLRIKYSDAAVLGGMLGLAVLSKVTALVLLPLICVFLPLKLWLVERRKVREIAAMLGLFLGVVFLLAGWYYLRNVAKFGHPIVVNWRLSNQLWWQDPGFHTSRYYLRFGEVFRHPYYSSWHSFWDAIYSTFWGDGFMGGETNIAVERMNPRWNYDYMSVTYLLSIPAAGCMGIGLFQALRACFTAKDISTRMVNFFMLASLFSFAGVILYSTLKVPIYSQAKAFYCLSVLLPIVYLLAEGFFSVDHLLLRPGWKWPRALLYGWLGTFFAVVYLAYL